MSNEIITKLECYKDRIAFNYNGISYTYKELIANINKMKKMLKPTAGEVVALVSEYTFDSISMFFALTEYGKIIVPITTMAGNQIQMRLEESYADVRIDLEHQSVQYLENKKEKHPLILNLRNGGTSGLILFSSGTTGTPKAMIHNMKNLINAHVGKKSIDYNYMMFLMFDHIGGLNTLLNGLLRGGTITIPMNRDCDYICDLIQKFKVNVLPVSPTFLNLLLISESYRQYDLSSLSLITYGTEPMPESLLKRLTEVFNNVKFLQTFGTSETGILKTSSLSSNSTLMKINHKDENSEYKIVDGELWLRSKTQVLGYLNKPNDAFTDDGWYKTGDQVEQTKDGYIRITGRIEEIINVGGQKVLPAEVESVLLEIDEIKDVIVYGEKNVFSGSIVVADIVLSNDMNQKALKNIVRKYCQKKMEIYKIPAKINIIENVKFSDRFKKIRLKKHMINR